MARVGHLYSITILLSLVYMNLFYKISGKKKKNNKGKKRS